MSHYTITPLEKKSIAITYEMFRENDDGSISWFNIEEHYRWGKGFIAEDMEVNLEADQTRIQYCKVDEGEYDGCDLEDPIACYFEFSDDLSDEEKEIKKQEKITMQNKIKEENKQKRLLQPKQKKETKKETKKEISEEIEKSRNKIINIKEKKFKSKKRNTIQYLTAKETLKDILKLV